MTAPAKLIDRVSVMDASGQVLLKKIVPARPWPLHTPSIAELTSFGYPQTGLAPHVNEWRKGNCNRLARPLDKLAIIEEHEIATLYGSLWLRVFRADGEIESLGLASLRLVTNNGVGFIVDAFQNLVELENMKFHGIGTGTNAEAAADSALQTELTTQYIVNSTRATGTTTENAANIYETVATNEVDASVAITEHGILSQAATGGGVLLDRSVFSAVNLASGDRLESTYRLTLTAGG